jgi:crossover junction endodeoxyribonuclease RusA
MMGNFLHLVGKAFTRNGASMIRSFFVPGTPQPKGSMKAFAIRTPTGKHRAVLTNDSAKTKPWQAEIASRARSGFPLSPYARHVAIKLDMIFYIQRPKSVSLEKFPYPTKKPDKDKLERCVCDALTGVIYVDDSQVVAGEIKKEWCDETCNTPGVFIMYQALNE